MTIIQRLRLALSAAISVNAVVATESAAFVLPAIKHRPSTRRRHLAPSTILYSNSISSEGGNNEENFYNDFEEDRVEFTPSPSNKPQRSISAAPDPSLFQSLQQRQQQLEQSSRKLLQRWTTGSSVKSFPAFTLNEQFYKERQEEQEQVIKYGTSLGWYGGSGNPQEEELPFDWVRRICIGTYPRVACGSAHGSIYVADVESRTLLGVARGVHSSRHEEGSVDGLDERLRQQLYGEYDGGGVLAVAMYGTSVVASSGREGGVKLFKLGNNGGGLEYMGDVPSLKRPLPGVTPVLVTCLEFDSFGRLYVGGQDGFLRMVTFAPDFGLTNDPGTNADEMRVAIVSSPRHQMQRSPVLSLDVSEELEMVATAHANGNVCVHSIHQLDPDEKDKQRNSILGVWNPFNSESTARSVKFVSGGEDEQNNPAWSIVIGGGNGELWMQEIHPSYIPTANDDVDDDVRASIVSIMPLFKENSIQQIMPNHDGPILSLASRTGGILVSAGQGGVLCVTQLWPTPKALYGLGGYKVWIGNVCIDSEGKRLLADGRDDVVVVHDFFIKEEEENVED